jgi:hypothetical protein
MIPETPAAPLAVNPATQIQYESGVRLRYAILLFAAAILTVGAELIQAVGIHTNVQELTLDLITIHKRFPIDIIGATLTASGLIALAMALNWLGKSTRAREPMMRRWFGYLVIIGAAMSAVSAVCYQVAVAIQSNKFVNSGLQSYPQANHLTGGGWLVGFPLAAQLGSILLAAGFIFTALNAMRVGLVTKWIGYSGVLAGALVLFPVGAIVPLIQAFWMLAAALLISGRNPSGDLPAWEQGISIPWGAGSGGSYGRGSPKREPRQPRPSRRQQTESDSDVIDAVTPDYQSRRKRKKR